MSAHDVERARRAYAAMDDRNLRDLARALLEDARAAAETETRIFAAERLMIIVEVLLDRLRKADAKTRRLELRAMKRDPVPEVRVILERNGQ